MIGCSALVIVVAGLVMTALVQVWPLRRLRFLLDSFAILPEWRFFAQASTLGADDLARDTHLIVRDRDAAGRIGGWQPVLSDATRRWHHAIWNPQARVTIVILTLGEDLARVCRQGMMAEIQQSLRYLMVLRCALEAPHDREVRNRQFAIVHTTGRQARTIGVDFVSAWHRW